MDSALHYKLVKNIAKTYSNVEDFKIGSNEAYSYAMNSGILYSICQHMHPRLNFDVVKSEALKSKTKIEFMSNIINTMSIVIFTTSDEKYFLLVLMATSKFTNSISLMMNSLNTYNINNSKYKSYLKLWKDKHFNVEEKQLALPTECMKD